MINLAAANTVTSTANAAAVITFAAPSAGLSVNLTGIAWSYSGGTPVGSLTITVGGTTVFTMDITTGGPGFIPFPVPVTAAASSAVVVTLAAGGSGIVGKLNVLGQIPS